MVPVFVDHVVQQMFEVDVASSRRPSLVQSVARGPIAIAPPFEEAALDEGVRPVRVLIEEHVGFKEMSHDRVSMRYGESPAR